MAVGETVGLDDEEVADDALCREAPAVYRRAHGVDDCASATLPWQLSHPPRS
jgi:hypothetical protein